MGSNTKKPFHFTEVDPKTRCIVCGKAIKKNLIARKANKVLRCFKHHLRHVAILKDMKKLRKEGQLP